ncbi:hypothetical protein CSA80_00305 [Candidatus Saccharibacteria bacterium]|nr:MAG: hypothetical protein CSA80_00305 [Candidatus Saccharibacteria bacterium]
MRKETRQQTSPNATFGHDPTLPLSHQRPDEVSGEWELVPPHERNIHQKIAAKTGGIVTVANMISVAGAYTTHCGIHNFSKGKRLKGLSQIAIGRSCDLLDGIVAKKLGTRSEVGAAVDAGLDKALTADGIFTLVRAGVIPPYFAAAATAQQACIMAENAKIKSAGGEPNPSKDGKYGMGATWAGMALRGAETMLEETGKGKSARVVDALALMAEGSALVFTQRAIRGYKKQRGQLAAG